MECTKFHFKAALGSLGKPLVFLKRNLPRIFLSNHAEKLRNVDTQTRWHV